MKVFLDFDRTLFDLDSFVAWTDEVLSAKFNLLPGTFSQSSLQHLTPAQDNLYFYEHLKHFQSVTGKSWSFISGELEKELRQLNGDFCFPEVHKTLHGLFKKPYDVRVLTFGYGDYQRFKLHTCSVIRRLHIPTHVVDEPKRLFLDRHFAVGPGVLVDDHHPLHLPPTWQHIWLDRSVTANKPQSLADGSILIKDLKQLSIVLNTLQKVAARRR